MKWASARPDASKRPRLRLASNTGNIVEELRRADPQCNIPWFDRIALPKDHIIKLATAVRSRYAVKQFCNLVNTKRDLGLQNILFPIYHGFNLAQQLRALAGFECSKVLTHFNQYLLAVGHEKARDGSFRAQSGTT